MHELLLMSINTILLLFHRIRFRWEFYFINKMKRQNWSDHINNVGMCQYMIHHDIYQAWYYCHEHTNDPLLNVPFKGRRPTLVEMFYQESQDPYFGWIGKQDCTDPSQNSMILFTKQEFWKKIIIIWLLKMLCNAVRDK